MQYSGSDVFVTADACGRTGATTLGVLAEALGDVRLGRAKAYAMMVGRVIDIDLDAALSPKTPVRWIGQAGGALRQGGAA